MGSQKNDYLGNMFKGKSMHTLMGLAIMGVDE